MPRRKSKFQPDRKVRILREYTGADDEFAWEAVSTAYAMRRDLRGSAKDEDTRNPLHRVIRAHAPFIVITVSR